MPGGKEYFLPSASNQLPTIASSASRNSAFDQASISNGTPLRTETFPALRKIEGFIDAAILRRAVPGGIEFLIVTRWSSMGAIEKFAGADVEVAVVPNNVQQMMLEYDRRVRHYEVVDG